MNISVLFWNVDHNVCHDLIVSAVEQYSIDAIFIIEPDPYPTDLLLALNENESAFFFNNDRCSHVNVFTKFTTPHFTLVKEFQRSTSWKYCSPLGEEITFFATHFYDKRNYSSPEQRLKLAELRAELSLVENSTGNDKVVLLGDLNMNPYEENCYNPLGLNALPCKKTVKRKGDIDGNKLFYNPSWKLLGDDTHSPGTYYFGKKGTQYWQLLDQVLLRPCVADTIDLSTLKILNEIGETDLRSSFGIPKESISDHLPVIFQLNLQPHD